MQIVKIVWTVFVSGHSVNRVTSYIINRLFSLPNGKAQKGVISKHNQVQVKYYLKILKYESISVRIQKKRKRCASNFCGGSTDLELQIIDMDPKVSKSVKSIKIGSVLGPTSVDKTTRLRRVIGWLQTRWLDASKPPCASRRRALRGFFFGRKGV